MRFPWILLGTAVFAAEPVFDLQLTCQSDHWFPASSVIAVPSGFICDKIQVRTRLKRFDHGSHSLQMGEKSLPSEASIGVDGLIVTARTREPLGLLTASEHSIRATVKRDGAETVGSWVITKGAAPHVEGTLIAEGDEPIEIRLTSPGPVLFGWKEPARVTGELRCSDCRLTAGGRPIERLPGIAGFQFADCVTLVPGVRELVITASNDKGSSSTVLVPIKSLPE